MYSSGSRSVQPGERSSGRRREEKEGNGVSGRVAQTQVQKTNLGAPRVGVRRGSSFLSSWVPHPCGVFRVRLLTFPFR
jgi:hypothetical protein